MLSRSLFVAAAAVASGAMADTIFGNDFPIIASVITSEAGGLTTYAVACPADSNPSTCNFVQPYTLVQGPSTVSFAMTVPGELTATLGCVVPASTSLSCSATAVNPSPTPQTVTSTTTFAGPGVTALFESVSIVTNSDALLTYSPTASRKGSNSTSTAAGTRPTSSVPPSGEESSDSLSSDAGRLQSALVSVVVLAVMAMFW